MARYDRLRGDSTDPVDAMRQAAPLFMRRPGVHDQPGAPRRPALEPGNGLGHSWVAAMHGPSREEFEAYQTALQVLRRGSQILHGMHARAARTGLPPLGEDDQRIALENTTSLPAAAISHVVSPTRRPWQQDFPFPIKEVLAVAAADTRKLPAAPRKAITRTERGVPS
jgi:hypothetical protein